MDSIRFFKILYDIKWFFEFLFDYTWVPQCTLELISVNYQTKLNIKKIID